MADDAANSHGPKLAYNLFRHKKEADLYCAVPQDRSVPAFLTEDKWNYARSLNVDELAAFGSAGFRASGITDSFHLFYAGLRGDTGTSPIG